MYKSFIKPIIDFMFSLVVLLFLFLPLLIIAILIKMDSKGPVFFLQERFGRKKKKFKVIKFITMTHTQRDSSGQTFQNDPEITKLGKILRRYKIDELPQFINVIFGDMAVVGPRPCLEATYNKFKNNDTEYRFEVKPGVTSNAGISGSIFLTWNQKWEKDKLYALNVNLTNDMRIILMTVAVMIMGEDRFLKK